MACRERTGSRINVVILSVPKNSKHVILSAAKNLYYVTGGLSGIPDFVVPSGLCLSGTVIHGKQFTGSGEGTGSVLVHLPLICFEG